MTSDVRIDVEGMSRVATGLAIGADELRQALYEVRHALGAISQVMDPELASVEIEDRTEQLQRMTTKR